MESYFKILQILCNAKKITYPEHNKSRFEDFRIRDVYWENSKNENNDVLTHIYFFMDRLSRYYYDNVEESEKGRMMRFIKHKYKLINDEFNNPFIKKSSLLEVIYKAQKTYNSFIKLAQIYRYSRRPQISEDLLLHPINEKSASTIKIYENKKLYLFTCNDLSNHIEISLSNCDTYYFATPHQIKNPYSNIHFSKSTLFNIYMKIRNYSIKFPMLFHQFFLCYFDMQKFKIENEYSIKDTFIKRAIYKPNTDILFNSMKQMISILTKKRLKINDRINKTEFIRIIRPYYYLYLIHCYHIYGLEKSFNSMNLLRRKIMELCDYNPKFGRVYMKQTPMNKRKMRQVDDLDHPEFTMNDVLTIERDKFVENDGSDEDTEDENEVSTFDISNDED